jgi:hypothetical protein
MISVLEGVRDLFYQRQSFLKDQGFCQVSNIFQKSKGELEGFTAVADVVKDENLKR